MLLEQFEGQEFFQSDPIPNGLNIGDVIDSQFGRVTIEGYDAQAKAWIVRSEKGQVFLLPETHNLPFLTPEAAGKLGMTPPVPHAEARAEMFNNQLMPLLDELQKAVENDTTAPPLKFDGASLDTDTRAAFGQWLQQSVYNKMPENKLLATKWGEHKRDSALLNYSRRFQYNNYLGLVAPFEFWQTQSMAKWAMAALDRPSLFSNYYRVHKFLNTQVQKPGFPSRLAGRIRIPIPFMPEWMGGGIYVDPLSIGLPLEGFAAPWEDELNRQGKLEGRASRNLETLLQEGQIDQAQYEAAVRTQSGDAWARAVEIAQANDDRLKFDGVDFASRIISPHLPLTWAYQAARGTPERIQPLPITRQVKALTGALGIGGPGGIQLEAGLRRHFDLPTFDEWEDYRVDRELANMAADGVINAEQATAAMIERAGPAFEQAQTRVAQSAAYGLIPSLIFGAPGGVYPEGEQDLRLQGILRSAAYEAENNGDTEALQRFFDTYPEYEARLALYDDKDERIRNFLVDQVWTAWNAMPALYRREAQAGFGPEFQEAFLDKETRNYADIPPEMLAGWARALGRYVPESVEGKGYDIRFAPPEVARDYQIVTDTLKQMWGENLPGIYTLQSQYFTISKDTEVPGQAPAWVQGYYDKKAEQFPGIDAILAQYDALPTSKARTAFKKQYPQIGDYYDWRQWVGRQYDDFGKYIGKDDVRKETTISGRNAFLEQYPILKEYWDARRALLEQYPHVQPYLDALKPEEGEQSGSVETPVISDPVTLRLATAYLFDDNALPPTTRDELQAAHQASGADVEFDEWLLYVLANGGTLGGSGAGPEFYPPGYSGAPRASPAGPTAQTVQNAPAPRQTTQTIPTSYAPVPALPVPAGTQGGYTGTTASGENNAPTAPVQGAGLGALRWIDYAKSYGGKYGVPPEFILPLIQAESGGNQYAVGDGGHSVGLFQLYDKGGVGTGYTVEQRHDPDLQFTLMMPHIAKAYNDGVAQGLRGQELATYVGGKAEGSRAEYHYRYGVAYQNLIGQMGNGSP
jgi:hypothetical protein